MTKKMLLSAVILFLFGCSKEVTLKSSLPQMQRDIIGHWKYQKTISGKTSYVHRTDSLYLVSELIFEPCIDSIETDWFPPNLKLARKNNFFTNIKYVT